MTVAVFQLIAFRHKQELWTQSPCLELDRSRPGTLWWTRVDGRVRKLWCYSTIEPVSCWRKMNRAGLGEPRLYFRLFLTFLSMRSTSAVQWRSLCSRLSRPRGQCDTRSFAWTRCKQLKTSPTLFVCFDPYDLVYQHLSFIGFRSCTRTLLPRRVYSLHVGLSRSKNLGMFDLVCNTCEETQSLYKFGCPETSANPRYRLGLHFEQAKSRSPDDNYTGGAC